MMDRVFCPLTCRWQRLSLRYKRNLMAERRKYKIMDADVLKMMDLRFDGFEKLFNKQNELVKNQISEMTKSSEKMSTEVNLIKEKLEALIKAEGAHYTNCPIGTKLETTTKEINLILDDIDEQIKAIKFIVPFKKLLYAIKFIVEWKVISIPVFVAICCMSVVGGVKTYETGKHYFMEWIVTKEQVDQNTKYIHGEEQKEIKDILKNEAK